MIAMWTRLELFPGVIEYNPIYNDATMDAAFGLVTTGIVKVLELFLKRERRPGSGHGYDVGEASTSASRVGFRNLLNAVESGHGVNVEVHMSPAVEHTHEEVDIGRRVVHSDTSRRSIVEPEFNMDHGVHGGDIYVGGTSEDPNFFSSGEEAWPGFDEYSSEESAEEDIGVEENLSVGGSVGRGVPPRVGHVVVEETFDEPFPDMFEGELDTDAMWVNTLVPGSLQAQGVPNVGIIVGQTCG